MFLNIILVNLRNKSKKHDIDATAQFAIETRRPLKTGAGVPVTTSNMPQALGSWMTLERQSHSSHLPPSHKWQVIGGS